MSYFEPHRDREIGLQLAGPESRPRSAECRAIGLAFLLVCLFGRVFAQSIVPAPLPLGFQITSTQFYPNATSVSAFARRAFFVDDADGDGNDDVAFLTVGPGGGYNQNNDGQLTVVSGITGGIIYQINGPGSPIVGLGFTASARIGDCNSDMIDDIAMIGFSTVFLASPPLYVFSGADGSLLYMAPPIGGPSTVGAEIERLGGDIDGDAIEDFCVGYAYAGLFPLTNEGCVTVHSGATGAILGQFWGTGPGEGLGFQIACPGDVDADGYPDVVAWSAESIGQPVNSRNIYVIRITPAGLSLLYLFNGLSISGQIYPLLQRPRPAGDVDGDGNADFMFTSITYGATIGTYVGLPPTIYSGATGQVIRSLYPPSGIPELPYGWLTQYVGDVDGDGVGDVAVAGPADDYGPFLQNVGMLYVFSGATGEILFGVHGDSLLSFPAFIDGPGDINGDGFGDVLAVATGNTIPTEGAVRVYTGRPTFEPSAAAGNIPGFGGAVSTDVLGVAASGAPLPQYGGIGRSVVLNRGSSFDFWMARPPAHSNLTAQYVLFGRIGGGVLPTATTLPFGLGNSSFGNALLAPFDASLFVLASTYPLPAFLSAVPAYQSGAGSPVVQVPPIPFAATLWFQAVIENSSSVGTVPLSVTNLVKVIVR